MAEWLTDGILWQQGNFRLSRLQEMSRTSGALQVRDLGPAVWTATFRTAPMMKAKAEEYHTILEDLGGALTTFLAHTAERPRPLAIPTGNLSGITILSIGPDNDEIALTGLAASRRLVIGDYLSILTQSGSRELVKVRSAVTSNAQSQTPLFRVTPHLRESVAVGDPVQLDRPQMEARIEPGSLSLSPIVVGIQYTVSFTALQVIR